MVHQSLPVHDPASSYFSYKGFMVKTSDSKILLLVAVLGLENNSQSYLACIFPEAYILCLDYTDIMLNGPTFLMIALLLIGMIKGSWKMTCKFFYTTPSQDSVHSTVTTTMDSEIQEMNGCRHASKHESYVFSFCPLSFFLKITCAHFHVMRNCA